MQLSELLGKLLPGHQDTLPIINAIREKYQIPEILPEDEDFTKILLSNNEIDWQAVRNDIEQQIRESDLFLPPATKMLYKNIQAINNNSVDFPELAPLDERTRNAVISMFRMIYGLYSQIIPSIDDMYNTLTDMIFENILTGKTREAPQDWFGKVVAIPSFEGETLIVAMAGEFSDPKVITEQFKSMYTKTFGKDRPALTDMNLKTAEFLAMKLQGKSLKYMVERYADKYPDQFPKNKDTKAYDDAVTKHKATMKKNIQRLQDALDLMIGDKN